MAKRDDDAGKPAKGSDEAILETAKDEFERARDAEEHNRVEQVDDLRFARLGEQWPEEIKVARKEDNRPCLTVNKMPSFIRQVVNDARQNKPAISVHPADDVADPDTADIMSGLIRNIEQSSQADVAYDTAMDFAVSSGLGYFRINTRYTSDDSFDQDIVLEPVVDPLTVYGDPDATGADSADWNVAFVIEKMSRKAFEERWKDAEPVDWDTDYDDCGAEWLDGDDVTVAEYWKREPVLRKIVMLSEGQDEQGQPIDSQVVDLDDYTANEAMFKQLGIEIVGEPRTVRSHKVVQRIITAAEVLETVEWAGKYIPIIPVYGEDITVEGVRYLRSLIRDAKDSQRRYNYHTTTVTELVALAPKTPFVGAVGSFDTDQAKWQTANSTNHAYIEYDPQGGAPPPQRMGPGPLPAAEMQLALNASDEMKSIMGLHDASLGARSNETSGKAIMARQREGDVSTFGFIDNLARAIAHGGRVLLDLIPRVYSVARVLRTIGVDGKPKNVRVNQQHEEEVKGAGGRLEKVARYYDLTKGKYDLTVKAGPSFTSRREEAATQMIELIRAYPDAAAIIGDLLAKNLDWPGADEVAERLQAMLPPQVLAAMGKGEPAKEGEGQPGQLPPEAMQMLQQAKQAVAQYAEALEQLKGQYAELQGDRAMEARKLDIADFEAKTHRMVAVAKVAPALNPDQPPIPQQFAA